MTVSSSPDAPLLPGPAPGRAARFLAALRDTWPGRLLVVGGVLKVVAWLVRLALGRMPTLVGAVDVIASVALIAAALYVLVRIVARARRRLLWRVRRKLILSYIFIGVVPALLIVSFFVVSGLVLFLNVASYLVRNGLSNATNEAVYLARMTAVEIQRGPGPQGAGPILEQREIALSSRYPGASIALVPTSPEPCVGSRSARGRVGALPELASAGRVLPGQATAAPQPGRVTPRYAGPWEHGTKPAVVPSWVNCSGFGGIIALPRARATSANEVDIVLRGVGLPDTGKPTYAVVVDIPKNDRFVDRIREQTSVKIDGVSEIPRPLGGGAEPAADPTPAPSASQPQANSGAPTAPAGSSATTTPEANRTTTPAAANRGAGTPAGNGATTSQAPTTAGASAQAETPTSGKRRISWVAWLECTDWATGEAHNAAAQIEVNIADIYDRVSDAPLLLRGQISYSMALLAVLFVIAFLFLVIEAAALVMGLALARSITGSIHELFAGTERVRVGDFSHRIAVRTHDQLGELAESFNEMTGSIEDLLLQAAEKKRLEEELRIARDIQMSLLPRGTLAVPGLEISALCVPAREVGGDYFDFLPIDENRLAILVADVSGKGTSAAFYMAELKGVILSLSRTCPSPRQLLITANRVIADHLDSRSFITMTYGVLDLAARTLVYARAGHTPLIYRHGGSDGRPVLDVLAPDGLVLGLRIDNGELFERLLVEVSLPLERGDVLVLFTDGISEAMNPDSDMFGEGRLAELVAEHGHLPVEELRERILREIEAFRAGAPQHDDMTMILLKVEDFVPGGVKAGFANGAA